MYKGNFADHKLWSCSLVVEMQQSSYINAGSAVRLRWSRYTA